MSFISSRGRSHAQFQAEIRKKAKQSKRKHEILHEAGKTYRIRDAILKTLGYSSYHDYLRSRFWSQLRRRIFEEKGSFCYTCPSLAAQLHHNDYRRETLLGEDISAIVPICEPCHYCVEHDADGNKLRVYEAAASWRRLRATYLELLKALG